MIKILLKLKDKEIKTLETDKQEITIGRNENNDICIKNLGASKEHARIFRLNGEYIIEDLKSTNGTLLNNESIITGKLTGNDVVAIGKHELFITTHQSMDSDTATGDKTVKVKT